MNNILHFKNLIKIIIIILLFPSFLNAQVRLQFDIISLGKCKDKKHTYDVFLLGSKGEGEYKAENGIFIVESGLYHASISINRDNIFKTVQFEFNVPKCNELLIKISLTEIMYMSTVNGFIPNIKHHFYYNCNILAEGECIDYYKNGKIRLKGKFSKGEPIGSLHTYLKSGHKNYTVKYNNKGKFRYTLVYFYDELYNRIGKAKFNTRQDT